MTRTRIVLSKKILIIFASLILFGLSTRLLAAEPEPLAATLNGYVRDKTNDESLIGATIYIVGTKSGSFTNKSGYFSITGIAAGEYSVRISSVGYKTKEEKMRFKKGESLRRTFHLEPLQIITDEISVTAEREVEKRQITISRVNVPIQQIKEIRVGGESDLFRSLQLLPGVLTSSQISSGLYIRGGSPDQNLVLLDGSTVYNPTHLFGFFSSFNSDAIKDVELIKGGYPAEYGSRLSSVINVTQKDGNRNKFEALGSIGMISSKLSLEGPLFNGSWFLGGRRTYLEIIKAILPEDEENPIPDVGFYDINAKITQKITDNDRLSISGFWSDDDFDFDASGLNVNMFMGNRSLSGRWTHIFGDNLFAWTNFSYSRYVNGMNQTISGYIIEIENSIQDYTLKTNFEWFASTDLTFKAGLEITNFRFNYYQNMTGVDTTSQAGTSDGGLVNLLVHDWTYAAYAQGNYMLTDLLSLQGGLRVEFWDKSRHLCYDPRIALRYQLFDNIAIKASYGWFHQYLRLSGIENFSLFDTWLPTDHTVPASKAIHYILSLESLLFEDYEFHFDVYYKEMENISESIYHVFEARDVKDLFYNGNGTAYGFEVFLQKRVGRFAGWIGYAYGHVLAQFDSINFGREFRPKYDRRHDFKAVLQYRIHDRWELGATFIFQSGQSFTGATSRFQQFLPDQTFGGGFVIPSQRYGLRLPPSHQLNLSGSYYFKMFGLESRLILDIYNVYNRRDILMRYYNTQDYDTTVEDIRLLPILPSLSFEVKF